MGLGWDTNKNSGSKGLACEVLVVQLGQTSKAVGTLIIPAVSANNQPVPKTKAVSKWLRKGGSNSSATIRS